MKNVKKLLAVLLCLCLFTALVPAAFAETAHHDITKAACLGLDNAQVKYELDGLSDDGRREYIKISFGNGDNLDEINLRVSLDSKYNTVTIFCFSLYSYDAADFTKVLRVCNSLNQENMYVLYTCDENYNEVDACISAYTPIYAVGDILPELIDSMVYILDTDYESFSAYVR